MKTMLCLLLAAAALPGESLFNGKNLDGWEVDTPNLWQVRDGMIVGKSPGLKYNDFLRTKQTYGDFALTLQFRTTLSYVLECLPLIGEQAEPFVANPHGPAILRLLDEEHRGCSSFYHPVHR